MFIRAGAWCKVMDKKTFTNPKVIKYVNKTYYAVSLDAEGKRTNNGLAIQNMNLTLKNAPWQQLHFYTGKK
jgi:hypothetical protein